MPAQLLDRRTSVPDWLVKWWPVLVGLLALYLPTYHELATGLWGEPDQAHGPIVLLVVMYLAWQHRSYLTSQGDLTALQTTGVKIFGWAMMISGLLTYIFGRAMEIMILEIGSQILVFGAILLLTKGPRTLRAMSFPLFFLIFMIPLPGFFVDAVTLPMKIAVSYVAENLLYWLDYPVARSGVIIEIGQYQLLVADACAGMHTLISLEALGLLYLNLIKHDSLFRNLTLAVLIVPISFTANVIRVIVLTLVTYYLGDEAGKGFVHGFAGIVLFVVALALIMSVDSILQFFVRNKPVAKIEASVTQ